MVDVSSTLARNVNSSSSFISRTIGDHHRDPVPSPGTTRSGPPTDTETWLRGVRSSFAYWTHFHADDRVLVWCLTVLHACAGLGCVVVGLVWSGEADECPHRSTA